MKSDIDVMGYFDETVCDAMLWQDFNANQNSQEISLAGRHDSDNESAPSPASRLDWDNSNFNWDTPVHQTNREDIFSQLNTPTRVQENVDWPYVEPLPISSSQSSATEPNLTTLSAPTPTEEESEDFYPYSQSSDDMEFSNTKVKDEPTASDSLRLPSGVITPCYYSVQEKTIPSTLRLIEKVEVDKNDLLQQAISTTMFALPKKLKDPKLEPGTATKRDAHVNDKKMILLMKKYKLDDNTLSDMTLDRLKAKCRSNKNDYIILSKYRRTCMNRYYARRSRNNKVTVTQTLEEQLSIALEKIEQLTATVKERDEQIAQLQIQLAISD